MHNSVRIIGGSLRSRHITVLNTLNLRPTSNRVRETLFNWLHYDIAQANCLDLFAGSGALGFEALSRGAKHVTFIEKDARVLKNLQENSAALKITAAEFIFADALLWLQQNTEHPFDIVFLDPPYAGNLLLPCLELLVVQRLLSDHAKVYLEHNQPLDDLPLPQPLQLFKYKKAGAVFYGLLEFSETRLIP